MIQVGIKLNTYIAKESLEFSLSVLSHSRFHLSFSYSPLSKSPFKSSVLHLYPVIP